MTLLLLTGTKLNSGHDDDDDGDDVVHYNHDDANDDDDAAADESSNLIHKNIEQLKRSLKHTHIKFKKSLKCIQNVLLLDNEKVKLSHYTLLRVLGAGGYGKVFMVRKNGGDDDKKLYAMKVLKKAAVQTKKYAEYIANERQIHGELNYRQKSIRCRVANRILWCLWQIASERNLLPENVQTSKGPELDKERRNILKTNISYGRTKMPSEIYRRLVRYRWCIEERYETNIEEHWQAMMKSIAKLALKTNAKLEEI
uniref:Protein kinase domain-containing protein n=1 Tax=Glossina brevipalpis TaxID=37001 RepID=A0A1A9WC78_9MUSC